MCYRFQFAISERRLKALFQLKQLMGQQAVADHRAAESLTRPRYNIAPSQAVFAVRECPHRRQREGALFNWGLIPFWSKTADTGWKLANARSETAHEKPAFRGPMRHHRCLIPASGFYEWKDNNGVKQPFYFTRKDRQPLVFVGLWEHWQSPDGSEIESCTILTREANGVVASIHDRMPVTLDRPHFDRWLDTTQQRPAELRDLLQSPLADALECWPVATRVNRTVGDDPEMIEPVPIEEQTELFP